MLLIYREVPNLRIPYREVQNLRIPFLNQALDGTKVKNAEEDTLVFDGTLCQH